jgi:RNA polymerase sigma factor (sigma-70 family)
VSIPAIDPDTLARARAGDLAAIDALLRAIQGGVFNLAMRMLAHREDARDATQEILLKVVTHLGSFRGEAAFGTWVWQVARNHLLNAVTRAREAPQVSLDQLAEELAAGRAYAGDAWDAHVLTPEDKALARELAITCTQGMLMRMDREHRLAYVLDATFGLASAQAGQVLGISAVAYRQRLSRARKQVDTFAQGNCGLANPDAPCRCGGQVQAIRKRERAGRPRPPHPMQVTPAEREAAARALDEVEALSGLAGVLRAHPNYQAPDALLGAIREVLAR